jgi:hypothetical protein
MRFFSSVDKSVSSLHIGQAVSTVRAKNLWEFRNTNMLLLAIVDELRDRLIDSSINAENICLKFTEYMRDLALNKKPCSEIRYRVF